MITDEQYMHRCLQLALLGSGKVVPNPMVGAVLVYNDRIIGEGWHKQYGGPHAEVNCFGNVLPADEIYVPDSTLYVSLEPCAHFGKTPPCSELVIQKKVKRVVIGMQDPFAQVNGKGIEQLKKAGIEVTVGVLEEACRRLNEAFITFHGRNRPFIVLKYAISADGFMAGLNNQTIRLSHPLTSRWVHSLRAACAGIMVGKGTALADNPQLTNRWWWGPSPRRILADSHLNIPADNLIFSRSEEVLILNAGLEGKKDNLTYVKVKQSADGLLELEDMLHQLYKQGIQSVLVEGGGALLRSFLGSGLWDKAFVIQAAGKYLGKGVAAPAILLSAYQTFKLADDSIFCYQNSPL